MKQQFDIQLPPYLVLPVSMQDTGQIQDWGHKYLRATELYGKTRGEKAVIFILDTAGQFDHPDLEASSLQEYAKNFTNASGLKDVHGHGTHCAGIAAAIDNQIGVIGVAPGAKLVPVKVLNDSGAGSFSWIANAIRYVADLTLTGEHAGKKKVISMSLGGPSGSDELRQAIQYAIGKGVFLFAAAGNRGYTGTDSVDYPGHYPEMITIASIRDDEEPSSFSSGGDEVDLAAPGQAVYSTHKDGGYAYLSGTSMATPHAAGVAALLVSLFPEIERQGQLEAFLRDHAKDLYQTGKDVRTGAGSPILPNYADQTPGEPGDDPFDPGDPSDPEPITREERTVIFDFEGKYPMWYRTIDGPKMLLLHVEKIRLSIETDKMTPDAYDEWSELVRRYFTNRAIILPVKNDYWDATYWSGRFLEIILGKSAVVSVIEICGRDEAGRPAYRNDFKPISKSKLKRLPAATFMLPAGAKIR